MSKVSITNVAAKLRRRQDGVTALEYALIAALIAVAIIAGATLVGTNAGNTFDRVGTAMN